MTCAAPGKAPTPDSQGVWSEDGRLYYYKGLKYWHKDIELIADMRRAGISSNTQQLSGVELEDFVKRCLDTEDYRVLGIGLEAHDLEFLKKLRSDQVPP